MNLINVYLERLKVIKDEKQKTVKKDALNFFLSYVLLSL